ncbi:MAG TPA: hypothetical protein VK589_00515 [Chryseolinea sp.]|nr:hypothetical protein [Chryseolinea sp.]
MKTRCNWFMLCLISVVMTCCIFEPDGDDNFKVVNPNSAVAPLQIDLAIADDTVDVSGPTYFGYDIKGFEPSRGYILLFITEGASSAPVMTEFNGELQYTPDIDSGYVKATIRVMTRSGTQSLADRLGLEQIVFERSWTLKVFTRLPKEARAIVRPEQGSLKVSWDKYNKQNFKAYKVIRIHGSSYSVEKTITDPDSTFYFDRAFVGGEVQYSIVTEVIYGGFSSGPFTTFDDQETPELVKYEPAGNGKLKLSWSSSRYPLNVRGYDILESNSPNGSGDLIYSTNDPNDTSFLYLPRFGQVGYINIYTYSKVNEYSNSVHSKNVEYVHGEKIEPYESIYFDPAGNKYFVKTKNYLSAYTIDQNLFVAKTEVPEFMSSLDISKDGAEIFGVFEDQLYSWNTANLQTNYQRDLSSLLLANQYIVGVGTTKDSKLLLSKSIDWSGHANLLFYDPVLQVVEDEYTGALASTVMELSANGDYMISQSLGYTRMSKLEDNKTVTNGVTATSQNTFFNPYDETQIIIGIDHPNPEEVYIYRKLRPGNLLNENPHLRWTWQLWTCNQGMSWVDWIMVPEITSPMIISIKKKSPDLQAVGPGLHLIRVIYIRQMVLE